MPGKWDYGQASIGQKGKYFPGSNEAKAWDEGWTRRYVEGPLSKANTVHDPVKTPAEFTADQAGWSEANLQTDADQRRGPAYTGSPP